MYNYILFAVPKIKFKSFKSPFCINHSMSGWIWTKESQKEIQEVKAKYDKDLSTIKSEMEASYRETLKQRCTALATVELELEKERQRVESYKQAMASHSHMVMEQRKKLNLVNPCLRPL